MTMILLDRRMRIYDGFIGAFLDTMNTDSRGDHNAIVSTESLFVFPHVDSFVTQSSWKPLETFQSFVL